MSAKELDQKSLENYLWGAATTLRGDASGLPPRGGRLKRGLGDGGGFGAADGLAEEGGEAGAHPARR